MTITKEVLAGQRDDIVRVFDELLQLIQLLFLFDLGRDITPLIDV
jgi:hypothetical protein